MKDKILWVCPSRKRPERLKKMLASWRETTNGLSQMLVAIDNDDNSYDSLILEYPEVIWEKNEPIYGSFLQLTNFVCLKYVNDYKFIGFMEDDVIFETKGYENLFIEKLNHLGDTGIVHALDGFEKPKLLTLPVVNSHIIKTLGWLAPPSLKSLWADDFWRELANYLKTYYKFENVMIRHCHYTTDNSIIKDEISEVVDANLKIDKQSYLKYMNTDFLNDMMKLKNE
jgi:hypothetical protein